MYDNNKSETSTEDLQQMIFFRYILYVHMYIYLFSSTTQ